MRMSDPVVTAARPVEAVTLRFSAIIMMIATPLTALNYVGADSDRAAVFRRAKKRS